MKNIMLMRVPPPASQIRPEMSVQWGIFNERGTLQGDVHISELCQLKDDWLATFSDTQRTGKNSAPEEYLLDEVIVLLSGLLTAYKKLPVSSAQKKHLATALPYMIEEDLAEDLDSLHLASRLDNKTSHAIVSIISHHQIQALLTLLDGQGLSAQQVLGEQQFVTSDSTDSLLLLPESQSITFVESGKTALTVDYDAFKLILKNWHNPPSDELLQLIRANDEQQTSIARAKILYAQGDFLLPEGVKEKLKYCLNESGWLVEEENLELSVFEYLARSYLSTRRSDTVLDFRHGPYKCSKRATTRHRRWKPLAIASSIWMTLQLGLTALEGRLYSHKAEEVWKKNAQLYLQAFPQDQQIKEALASGASNINIKSRLQSRLKTLEKSVQPHSEFLPLLQHISAVAASVHSAKVEPLSVDFNHTSGRLILDFKADNLEGIDQLVAAATSSGLVATLDNASQGAAGASARVTIARDNR